MYSRALQILNDQTFTVKSPSLRKRLKFIIEKETRQNDMENLRSWSNRLLVFLSSERDEKKNTPAPEEDVLILGEENIGPEHRLVLAIEFGLEYTGMMPPRNG